MARGGAEFNPTFWQRVFTSIAPLYVCLAMSSVGLICAAIWIAELSRSSIGDWRSMLYGVVVIAIAAVGGIPVGMILASVVLPPLYRARVRLNGGPFKVGDRVRVIQGSSPYFGCVATVCEESSSGSVRIELGRRVEEKLESVFEAWELERVSAGAEGEGLL